jgi:hypothetical protein
MIGHELHRSGSFWSFLLSIDKDLADSTRQKGCSCGGRVHSASYPRAPRGGPDHRLSRRSYAVDDREKRLETPLQGRPGPCAMDRAGTSRTEAVDRAQQWAARIR